LLGPSNRGWFSPSSLRSLLWGRQISKGIEELL
jgi:hypothetical protein